MPIFLTLCRQKLEYYEFKVCLNHMASEFNASLGYRVKPCLQTKVNKQALLTLASVFKVILSILSLRQFWFTVDTKHSSHLKGNDKLVCTEPNINDRAHNTEQLFSLGTSVHASNGIK